MTTADGLSLLQGLAGSEANLASQAATCNDGGKMVGGYPARDDANCDKHVNTLDVLAIFKHAAGVVTLPASCASPTPSPAPTSAPG